MRPLTQLLVVVAASAALNLAVIAMLHTARQERDALDIALVDTTLKRNALRELSDYRHRRAQASSDLLSACRNRLALRDVQHDSTIIELAIRGAEHYDATTTEYVNATAGAE